MNAEGIVKGRGIAINDGTGAHDRVTITNSDLGPIILAGFAFYLIVQGILYIARPEMTSRALTSSKQQMRRNGFILSLIGSILLYAAFSWWGGG